MRESPDENHVKLFGVDIEAWPRWSILLVSVLGILLSFLLQSTANETIYQVYSFKESLFLTCMQFLGYSSLSLRFFIDLINKKTTLHAPFWFYLVTSFFLLGSMGLSNFSLEHINFPTQTLFRSSKLIPVMIGSMIFLKRRYSIYEFLAVMLIVGGLIGISFSDKVSKNKVDWIGLTSVTVSLFCDSFASNLEEKAFETYGATQNEVISMIYILGAFQIGALALITGQFGRGIAACTANPQLILNILMFSILGGVGVQFVYILIKKFSSFVAVMVTSLRKALTVCLSFILFPGKHFTVYHLVSIIMIFAGVAIDVVSKKKESDKRHEEDMAKLLPNAAESNNSDELVQKLVENPSKV